MYERHHSIDCRQSQTDFANAYYNRGIAKTNSGDYEGTIADYDTAMTLHSDYVNGNYSGRCVESRIELNYCYVKQI